MAVQSLALFGGVPQLRNMALQASGLPRELVDELRAVFARRYFANNGPLVRGLDQEAAVAFGFRHAICVGNGASAVMLSLRALAAGGEVLFSALGRPEDLQALRWAGFRPVFFDSDGSVSADDCGRVVATLAEPGQIPAQHPGLVVTASCALDQVRNGSARAVILVFDRRCLIRGADSACILTDDDGLAADLAARRAFHATDVAVDLRLNGKMSEGQAAAVLADLARLPERSAARRAAVDIYRRILGSMPRATLLADGLTLELHADLGIDAPAMSRLLAAEGVACSAPRICGQIDAAGFPDARRRAATWLTLPDHPGIHDNDVHKMRSVLDTIFRHAEEIATIMELQS
ncbi:MAG: DegT/DnrJ/EryC1/StrS family aminotransferase [Ferrovibrionaceae bacterium]